MRGVSHLCSVEIYSFRCSRFVLLMPNFLPILIFMHGRKSLIKLAFLPPLPFYLYTQQTNFYQFLGQRVIQELILRKKIYNVSFTSVFDKTQYYVIAYQSQTHKNLESNGSLIYKITRNAQCKINFNISMVEKSSFNLANEISIINGK